MEQTSSKSLSSSSNKITIVLWGASEHLAVEIVDQAAEGTRNNLSLGIEGVGSHVGHLQQHSTDQVHTLQQFEINVHVEWNLAFFLCILC